MSTTSSRSPVRVLWLIKGLGPGGAEQLLVAQARARDREAFDCRVAYLVPAKQHLVPALEAEGVEVTALDAPHEWDPRWALRLRRSLRDRPVEIIHVHSPYVASVTRLLVQTLPRATRPAIVYTEHNRWPRHRRMTRFANRLTLPLDAIDLAVSEDVRQSMPRRRQRDVEVLVHGIDVDEVRTHANQRKESRVELEVADDEVVVGIIANLRREKGYDVLIDAAEMLVADPPAQPFRVISVGQGPLEGELRARLVSSPARDHVHLLGYRDDARSVAAAFDIFTLASRHEGLPVALMEALALGLPVVATRAGGIPEAITDGREGRLVPVDDARALANALRELIDDEPERARLAHGAAVRADAFAVEPAVRTIEARYRALADRQPGDASTRGNLG